MEGMSFEQALADLVAELGGAEGGMLDTAATYAPGIAVQDGRPSLENDYSRPPQARPRPADAMQPVAQTFADINPVIVGQGAGLMASDAYNSARKGDYTRAAGEGLVAASALVPAPMPRPMGAAAQTARRATMREAFAPRPVNPITPEQIAAQENRLLALQSGRPASPQDVPKPIRETVEPQYWSAPASVRGAVDSAPVVGAIGGGTVAIAEGGDPMQTAGAASLGGLLGLAARGGGRAAIGRVEDAARARGPVNAQQIVDADVAYSQGINAAAGQQTDVNRLLALQEQARMRSNMRQAVPSGRPGEGLLALPQPVEDAAQRSGMAPAIYVNENAPKGSRITDAYVSRQAHPLSPMERPNPAAQRRYEAETAYQNSAEAKRIADAAQARNVEAFAPNLDNPEQLTKNLKLFSDVTAQMGKRMEIEDIAKAMEARGMFVDMPQHFLQPRNNGQFAKMSPEAKRFRDAIWEARNAREKRMSSPDQNN